MKRVAVILMLAVALAGVLTLTSAASVTNAAQAGENTAASSTALVGGCYRIPLTISFPALYAASNPVNNMPTLWVMDNGNGAVIYKALIASGAKSVTIPNTLTGRSYYIRIGFDRNPPLERNTIVVGITQSGETADTLAALRESKRKGLKTLSICNVVGSTIAREADGGVYLHAGPEIGVASTKAFTAQLSVLTLLAVYLGRMRHLSYPAGARILEELKAIPDLLRTALECHAQVTEIAERYHTVSNMLYLGRQYLYPLALEGALKLKEISYIHAEGYPAAEMKHGPIALVDENTPSVFLAPHAFVYDKVMSNLEEIKARGGPVIAVACEDDDLVTARADEVITIPNVPDYLQPIVAAIPLQLLAYEIARLRGCDIDRPRNLAKSVTVE